MSEQSMMARVGEAIRLRAIERGQPIHPTMIRYLAHAAIAAMHHTEAMRKAGAEAYANGNPNDYIDPAGFGDAFEAAIECALKED